MKTTGLALVIALLFAHGLAYAGGTVITQPVGVSGATSGGGLVKTGTTLGLLTTCSSTQVLAWNGSAWACAAAGGGGVSDGDKGDVTVSGGGATWTIDNGVVTLAKQANVATATILGRVTAGAGSPEALTGTQATTLLDVVSSSAKGLAPASGGGSTNFLRADGTWTAPAGTTYSAATPLTLTGTTFDLAFSSDFQDSAGSLDLSTAVTAPGTVDVAGNFTAGDSDADSHTLRGAVVVTKTGVDSSPVVTFANDAAAWRTGIDGSDSDAYQITETGVAEWMRIRKTTGAASFFGSADVAGDFSVATNKFTVAAASGNTAIAGTLGVGGQLSLTRSAGVPVSLALQQAGQAEWQIWQNASTDPLLFYNSVAAGSVCSLSTGGVLNCVGGLQVNGTSVATTSNISGTIGKLAKFTGANTVGDSIVSESGTALTVDGTLSGGTGGGSFTISANGSSNGNVVIAPFGATYITGGFNVSDNTTLGSSNAKVHTINGSLDINAAESGRTSDRAFSVGGTTYSSLFQYGVGEAIYIRGGKVTSTINIGDVNTGNVNIGAASNTTNALGNFAVVGNANFNSNSTFGDDSNDSTTINGQGWLFDTVGTTLGSLGGFTSFDDTSMGAGVGGAVYLGGKVNAAGDYTWGGVVKAAKATGVDGATAFDMVLGTNAGGGVIAERARIFGGEATGFREQLSAGPTTEIADSFYAVADYSGAAGLNWLASTDALNDGGPLANDIWCQNEHGSTLAYTTTSLTTPRSGTAGLVETVGQLTCTDGGTACSAGGSEYRFNTSYNAGNGSTPYADARGVTVTFSVWLKASSGTPSSVVSISRDGAVEKVSATCTLSTSAWTRCSVTSTLSSTNLGDNSEVIVAIEPRTTSAVYLFGAQLEDAAGPTPYHKKTALTAIGYNPGYSEVAGATTIDFLGAGYRSGVPRAWTQELHVSPENILGANTGNLKSVDIYGSTGYIEAESVGVRNGLYTAGPVTFANGPSGINNAEGTHQEWTFEAIDPGTFMNNSSVDGGYRVVASGTSSDCSPVGGTSRPGVYACDTGSTTTGRSAVYLNPSLIDFGAVTSATTTAVVSWDTLSDATQSFGSAIGWLDNPSTLDQVDGCYFLLDERNAATGGQNPTNTQKLQAVCSANSARTVKLLDGASTCEGGFGTSVDTTISAATFIGLRVVMTGNTQASFQKNTAGTWTEVCRLTTNIPTGTARLTGAGAFILKSAGTTSRLVNVDYITTKYDLTTPRSP